MFAYYHKAKTSIRQHIITGYYPADYKYPGHNSPNDVAIIEVSLQIYLNYLWFDIELVSFFFIYLKYYQECVLKNEGEERRHFGPTWRPSLGPDIQRL